MPNDEPIWTVIEPITARRKHSAGARVQARRQSSTSAALTSKWLDPKVHCVADISTIRSLPGRIRVMELVTLVLLFVAYNVVRTLPSTTAQVAVAHAHRVLSWEGPLFSHLELPLNEWLAATPVLAVAACYFYAGLHYLAISPTGSRSSRSCASTRSIWS